MVYDGDLNGVVSPEVSLDVSRTRPVSASEAMPSTASRRRSGADRSAAAPGRYLVRQGSVYLFQIRLPVDIGGTPGRVVRIGLGALTARDARLRAETLAALARERIRQIRVGRMTTSGDGEEAMPLPVDDEAAALAAAELKGFLKAHHGLLSNPAEPPPAQVSALAGLRQHVLLGRELAKGEAGNPLIVENAALLRDQANARLAKDLRIGAERADTVAERPVAPPPNRADAIANSARFVAFASPATGIDKESPTDPPNASVTVPVSPHESTTPAVAPQQARTPRVHRDETGKIVPAFKLDRRTVARRASDLPKLSEVAEEYYSQREIKLGKGHKTLETARSRMAIFFALIGDHPVDTYEAADLQAYIAKMAHWPALVRHRPDGQSPLDILADNADLKHKPITRSALEDGYVTIARTIIRSKTAEYGYPDPFLGARLEYPATAAPRQSTEPLSFDQRNRLFRTGVAGGLLDEAMLPLLGDLTGRRLGLLTFLQGNDIREKYQGVFVAQTSGIVLNEKGRWERVPIKNEHSTTFFVLHDFLREIGFIDWAIRQGEQFLFPTLTSLADPSKSASSYMQRLFRKAGIKGNRKEVFHSFRGGQIELMRDQKVDARDRKIQVGHKLDAEHDIYGFKAISELRAREIARAPLEPEVDYSVFRGLNFDKMAGRKRTRGRRPVER
ncbi:hypothetical protein OHA_1_02897 [Pleomorphomonas sp. SM30]|uniref:Phage integrase family protein n=1 Tax=Oharaeibacter diazotrophicus TaxID=1920512 RepID=A0A4R6RDC7_9HYPH|nr:hypothetical protein EDD54_2856 [Oharaeibacter diazotrophicus]BBE73288.1 hypothetical protein OHA_1_02897 [Pleomorphomonas sp. SM30]GLS75079.1 hypothetical protein GCM10007904_04140 [Oharaeibacter diazotrophicus]